MSETKSIEDVYTIIIDEIDYFMEGIYKENLLYEKIIDELQKSDELPEEIKEIANDMKGSDHVLSRLDNMKFLLKSIAYQNHNLMLYTNEEKENVFVKLLLGLEEVL